MILKPLANLDLKNKFFTSILAVILIISCVIALLARWILVSGLTQELELRGTAVAQSIAARGGSFLLEDNIPELLSLIFDEKQLRERKHLVDYIYVENVDNRVLCHTFTRPFPEELPGSNPLPENIQKSVRLVALLGHEAYDIAVPVKEGLYRIGTVHVGLSKEHIDSLVGKLRVMFLGFISAIIIITFYISHRLAGYITNPVVRLTRISDDLSRGSFDSAGILDLPDDTWNISDCPAFSDTDMPCWHFDDQRRTDTRPPDDKALRRCKECVFYRKRESGDEVEKLTDSFRNMVWSIRLYRRRLSESENTYRSLFNSGPDPIFVVDCTTQNVLDANPRAEEVYGFSRKELVGMDFTKLGPVQTRECLLLFEGGGDEAGCVRTPRVVHHRKNGVPMFVNVNACPISYRGRPAIIVAATDVTEIVEKDAQLIQASKMKSLGEMSAGVAHELNQPLNAIRMGSDFLAMSLEQGVTIHPEHFRQVVTEISAQVDRASGIINTLRSFGRKADLFDEDVNLNQTVQAVTSLISRQFLLHQVDIKVDLAAGLPVITAQDNRLQQVLFNLVTNARDAIIERRKGDEKTARGLIDIRTFVDRDQVCLSVSDNGTGIPQHVLEKVFEPFFTTKVTGEGMGLGLAISYGIVRDYMGDITIRSREGEGTTFTLRFPKA
ncbi:PAS domain S-box protein [Desulfovibrio subterraneus]|uniref:histidine kinase n=1 Tax=Desulfovibrio subterraneus TaxID=2718620 RepID=A0A7J0BF66_9BACT|nr:ATP-binding protein [Desulfovibrio subterraneus]WBF68641.1 PAS domain S-box protein [Desulfovibrio subterraneus]GFM31821.1 histidine kinase [Desulfovibrio subterraneus]